MKRTSNENSLAEVLEQLIRQNGLKNGIDAVNVELAWKEVMGNGVNYYTRAVHFAKGILTVELNSSVLREELYHGKSKMLKILNEHLGGEVITDIVLR
jgi:predicted nucleic acid-binding Zn ribbon protein